jgi:hypothetical protein
MLISSTPPSKKLGGLASRLKLLRNVTCAMLLVMAIGGESSRLSLTTAGLFTHAALGSESAGGAGNPEFELCHKTISGSTALVAVHPAGSAGGVTPSKFSLKNGT